MPSFFPRQNSPRQWSPTEFMPPYQTTCGGMPYQQHSYSGLPGIRRQDDGYDFADRYSQLPVAIPPMYPQSGTYLANAQQPLPRVHSLYDSVAPTQLPPMRMSYGQQMGDHIYQQQRVQEAAQHINQQQKEEKPVGGVSAKLDYDMEVMTDFVCETALCLITPGRTITPSFRKWTHQVLCATRLPSATILLSMFYLAQRMPMLSSHFKSDDQLTRLLTISLVLGSKFLDDNTFINRSWSEVSGIPVADLNRMETEWLVAIGFQLHRDPREHNGWNSWSDHWKGYRAKTTSRSSRVNKLTPIDTSLAARSAPFNQNKPLPPLPTPQSYNLPPLASSTYPEFVPKSAQYPPISASSYYHDHWRSNEYSPESAPTTGPTTPDNNGSSGPWAPSDGYSRRTMFGYPAQHQPPVSHAQPQPTFRSSVYGGSYNHAAWPSAWNGHDYNCGCMSCAQGRYMHMMHPQPIAA
ncbi:hypothetical protein M011DRAFT_495845 [Sporormia fimetaria CBS 119925]|uniref:Cyclin-like protein n=1 Tax=Sporormia fimetaria CBS 119925 TaxID=1340428 RepID=A0A6A6V728_9PLEO|nr:hypothetical protein M011DRAFT_495845 [Sporormia fimetaria CBS 119925]